MTTLARLAISLFLALLASSCVFDVNFGPGEKGNGEVVEDLREVDANFTAVEASEGIAVYVKQAPKHEVRVEADENIIDLIGTRVRNGELQVYAIENIGKATKKVYVSLPEITALDVNSGADLIADQVLETESISIDGSSGGRLRVQLQAGETEVDASSGANLELVGTTTLLYVDASSGANIRARDLASETCKADASSGANISLQVNRELTADASSGANIMYKGEAELHKKRSFSGNVRKE